MSRFPIYEDDIVIVDGELCEGEVFLHSEVRAEKFTKAIYTYLLELWLEITEALKNKKIDCVFSCIPKDEKIMKWQSLFGMSPILETEDHIIYRREL